MEELRKLYDVLVREGKYTKSFEEFQSKWSQDEAYKNKVYDVVTRDGLYSKDRESFFQKYSAKAPVQKIQEEVIVKKKEGTELPLGNGGLEPTKITKQREGIPVLTKESLAKGFENMPKSKTEEFDNAITNKQLELKKEVDSYQKPLMTAETINKKDFEINKNIEAGFNDFNKVITSIPESIYNLFSIPQNAIAAITGLDIATDADNFKKVTGITNPIYDYYKEEGDRLDKEIAEFNEKNYESSSIYENISKGNYGDAFELLGSGILRSAPTSLAIMAGGSTLKAGELTAAITTAFYNQNLEQLKEDNPDASAIENNIKALGMSAAEGVFSSIGTGQIGAVYRDIIKREGVEAGSKIFRNGLIEAYKGALKKYGVPIGALGEGVEEAATQITQNMISGKPAFEGAVDAFILGNGSGVVFTAPITLKKAKESIKNQVNKIEDNKKIVKILDGNKADLINVFDVSKNDKINEKQIEIASLNKSRELLNKELKNSVNKGLITKEQAAQSLYIFDKTQQITGQLRGIDIDKESKLTVANLLKEREDLSEKISGKDEALVVLEKNRINEINDEIKNVILNSKKEPVAEYIINEKKYTKEDFVNELEGKTQEELNAMEIVVNNDEETANIVTQKFKTDAIQEQSTATIPVQSETGIGETLEEGISQPKSEIVTEQVTQEEVKDFDLKLPENKDNIIVAESPNGFILYDSELRQPIEVFNNNAGPNAGISVSYATQEEAQARIEELKTQPEVTAPQTIIEEQVSSKTQPETIETVETKTEGPIQEVTTSGMTAFNEGVESVQQAAIEYRNKITEEQRQKQRNYQPGRSNPPMPKLFERVSKMMADVYQAIRNEPTKAEVKRAYDALVSETKKQYEFIVSKGLKVIRHEGVGEPYANSQEMLRDIRENNTLRFLPNDVAFGQGDVDVSDNIGLQPSGIRLEDGYELTNSEVFRIVHDYFGHGILGNQFGAIGEENATLQHLDLYSDEAAPAVIFQTRGQNSWVNFSGVNKEANDLRKQARELRKQGKEKEANELVEKANKLFKFAEPKIAIFPTKFNFKRYETARRIAEQEEIDSRPNRRTNVLSELLEKYSKRSSGTRGVNKRDVRGVKRLGAFDINVIAEYTLDEKISEGIKKAFPNFKGVQKIYEVTDGNVYRQMMVEALKDNKFAASVTVHSAEKFDGMRMFVTEDGSTGITLTSEGFLGGAFSNPKADRPQNLAQLMVIGIKEGATTAEAFDTILPDYYANFGFKAVSRTAFNEEFKPMIENGDAVKDWDFETYRAFNNGRPDAVFFIYDGGNRNTIEDRLGLFDLYKNYEKANTESFDKDGYEQAEEVMKQQAVKRLEFELGIDSETGVTEAETEVQETTEAISQELNEQDLPGYDRMMKEVEGIVKKSKSRGVSEAKTADNVIKYVMGSKAYENATDVQREALVRDIRKRFGLKEKAAPSVARILGKIKDVKKVTMTEKTALKKQIKDLARGARDAVRAQKLVAQQLTKDIKELASEGKITANQAANVLRAFSKVNVFSQKSIDRFTDYMTRVFENADYAAKIKQAKSDRGAIKKLSKNKDKNANLRVLAAEFVKIDPAIVEDIDAYNNMASRIKEAVKGSSVRGQKVKFAETVNIQDATDYINKIKKEQEQKLREEKIAEIQSLMDVDASEFSTEDMLAILGTEEETPEGTKKYNEGIVRATVKRAFDVYSSMIKKSINTGKDVFTDEDVSYTSSQKKLIKDFMAMDTDNMSIKDSVAAIDSLVNFLVNQSTAKMEAVVRKYTGQQNAAKIRRKGIFAVPLKKLGLESFGRFLGEQTTTLNMLFEKMFVGFNRSAEIMEAMGLNDLINGKSLAQRQSNNIINDYVSEFYNKKANGQKFNTLFNNVERGMAAFAMRNVIGTEAEMKAEFNRRKKLIEESIEVLSSGNEKEVAKSLVYQEVYDKVLKDSNNISDVESKVDKTNLEAIDFWKKQWDDKFERLSDTALNIYNKVLDKDLNFIPDRFTRISYDGGTVDLANADSAFISNTNGRLYKKQTGVLMEATKPKKLPINPDTNEAESYIDLSFDKNNSNSMYDALVDIETAGPIRQVEAFMNTSDFRKIFGKDGDIVKGTKGNIGRVQQYIQNIRNKNPYSNDEFSKMMQVLNKVATLGVGQALAGPTQPLKQVLPVITNTLINNKGNIDFSAMSNPDFMNWLNGIGYAISNRGVESQADIDSINNLINQAAESKVEKGLKIIEDANKKYLKLFLVKPDVWVAISSWKAYYEQSLKKQGIEPSGIDYSTHEVNKKAADYAQKMVDRQQNISDTDMAGSLFANRNPFAQTMVKVFMPFASFRMNQASRLGSDLRTLKYWNVSTAEDKKIAARSLAGYAVEMATFRALSASISILLASAAASLMGRGDDEEEKEKRNKNLIKGALTSTVTDIFSPIPVADKLIQNTASDFLKLTQDALDISEKDRVSLYDAKKQNFIDGLGTFGIAVKRGNELWDILSLSVTGEYEDDFGKTKVISEDDKEALEKLFPFALAANLTGLASPEVSTVGRNAVRISKKKAPSIEQREAKDKKIEIIEDMISKSKNAKQREAAEKLLEKIEVKDSYELEEQELKEMKNELLVDRVKGVTYKTVSDLKRYNKPLWIRNFGPKSEWHRLTKEDKAAEKILREELQKEKDKEYGYTKPTKRKKNKDGTYKKSYKYKKKKD